RAPPWLAPAATPPRRRRTRQGEPRHEAGTDRRRSRERGFMKIAVRCRLVVLALVLLTGFAAAQQPSQTMSIAQYEPKSTRVVPEHKVTRAKYPLIDVHNHQDVGMSPAELDRLVKDMDSLNMRVMVNLSGTSGASLANGVKTASAHPGRLLIFANLDFSG